MVQSIGSMKMTGILTGLMNGVACGGIEGYNRGMRNGGTTVGLVCGHCCHRWKSIREKLWELSFLSFSFCF